MNPDLVRNEFDLRSLQSSLDGRFVTARVVETSLLADRVTGAGFRWDADAFRMVGVPDGEGRALFVSADEECWFYAVEFRALEAVLLASSRLSAPPERCPQLEGLFSPDGGSLFLQAGERVRGLPEVAGLYVVDLAGGATTRVGEVTAAALVKLHRLPDGSGVLVVGRSGGNEPSPRIEVSRYGWDGTPLGERRIPIGGPSLTSDTVFPSPDGRLIAWQEHLPLGIPLGLGGSEQWPLVAVADLGSGEVRFRVLRASMTNGTGFTDWLADGSALLVATVDGYALLRASDGRLTPLGFGTVSHFEPRPIPARDAAGLFAFGGRVVDRRGAVVRPVAAAAAAWGPPWGVFTHYDWGATSEALRFSSTPPFGRDFGPGGLSIPTLEARVQSPPFDDELRLRVTGTVTHLNLRAEPSADAALVGAILEGEVVTVVDALGEAAFPCGGGEGCSVAYDSELPGERWWLSVRTADGLEGWAASDFLDWAD